MNHEENELIGKYLDGKLSNTESESLQNLLRNSKQARHRLQLFAAVSEGLAERSRFVSPVPKTSRFGKLTLPWSIAAAALIFAFINWKIPAAKTITGESGESFLALLVDEAGAKFSEGNGPEQVRFGEGNYVLDEGAVHVRFSNGADLLMKAPVSFAIDSAYRIRLHEGSMRAVAPPSAQGFTIATPGVNYEDLGTEFGISVNRESGVSELHVFDGQVDAKDPESNQLLSSFREGQSVTYTEGTAGPAPPPDSEKFLTPGSIGFLRWKIHQRRFGNDPDLLACYSFTKPGEDISRLRNEAKNGVASDGDISGARWVSGRWPGKDALLFDRDNDFVEIDLPGNYKELTFAAWVKLDRFDFSHTSLFDSNGWSDGDVHWQFNRSGSMWIAAFAGNRKTISPPKIVPTGQWVHLAAVISLDQLKSEVFVNGTPSGASQIPEETILEPGISRIGNWLWDQEWPYVPIRALRGRMDEFAIWKRALTEPELQKLVEEGKPAPLWTMQKN